MKRKTKLFASLILSSLSMLCLGAACATSSGESPLGEEYNWIFNKPYAGEPDEGMKIDGYLKEDVWADNAYLSQTIGTTSWSATTHFTEKGLYIGVKATDFTMNYKTRFTNRSYFSVYVCKTGTETIDINGLAYHPARCQQFQLDPYYCRSKNRVEYYYEAQVDGELNSEDECISMLDGSFTMAAENGGVVFPNTATTNAFEYTAVIKAASGRDQSAPMATISTSKAHISVGMYQYGQTVYLNVSDGKNIGTAFNEAFRASALPDQNNTYTVKFVRKTNDAIECYINSVLVFKFTKAELVLADGTTDKNWIPSANDVWTGWNKTDSFFAENANVCAGVMNGFGVNNYGIKTADYTLSMKEFATVTGTITAGENVDLTQTTISAGGIACNATINADGTYVALVPEGEQTLEFANGVWGATQAINAVMGETNTANVTLIDYTWKVGGFGSVTSKNMTYVEADTLDGNFAVTSTGSGGLLFPNLATTDNFTFEVAFTGISRADDDDSYGICISNGNFVISISFQRWEPVVFNMGTGFGAALIEYWNHGTHSGYNGSSVNKLKFVRTAEKIEFYYANVLYATFTTEATYSGMSGQMWGGTSTQFRDYYANHGHNFIGADKELTVGLVTLSGCKGFTAECTFTKN